MNPPRSPPRRPPSPPRPGAAEISGPTAEAGAAGRAERLRALLDEAGLGAVVLRRPENFAWYTGGADNRVDHSSATGVADIVVSRTGSHVVTNNIEAPRMREEQTPGWDV
ncbi:MAG TPA: aminopeptidase P family N-terminal domain-containing protein, partial [Acidimicrobiia bacterium]|nr:aminopeptidase P family N-terminal domain-containing protein [Acidimicrobiia bacterium]